MARDEAPPFQRGETWYGGETIDTNDLGGEQYEGKEYVFEDIDPDNHTARTGRKVVCRVVRNNSGISLLPKRLALLEGTAGDSSGKVDGYAITSAANTPQQGYPIDEYLPSTGVPNGDLFYIVVEGPAVVTTSLANMATDLSVNEFVVAVTAATSQATTAGRVIPQLLSGATAPLAANIQNRIGRAMTSKVTTDTGEDLLVDVGHW